MTLIQENVSTRQEDKSGVCGSGKTEVGILKTLNPQQNLNKFQKLNFNFKMEIRNFITIPYFYLDNQTQHHLAERWCGAQLLLRARACNQGFKINAVSTSSFLGF